MRQKGQTKALRRRREPPEVLTRKAAIRSFCLECLGCKTRDIRGCTAHECHLWPYRLGGLDVAGIEAEKASFAGITNNGEE